MKNTITIGIDTTKLTQEINAECAWVDITNIAVLPPIVNPLTTRSINVDVLITESIDSIIAKLSGYINTFSTDNSICNVELFCTGLTNQNQLSLRRNMETFIRYDSLFHIYCTQQQAKHLTDIFRTKRDNAIKSIKQALATIQ